MRHSVFAGGKRLRPVLAQQAAVTISGALPKGIARLGAALEMLHTYSLIHDDLPALDNDDLRRGKPTCHVVFGEAIAILAGDALQTAPSRCWPGLGRRPRPQSDRPDYQPGCQRRRHCRGHDRRPGAGPGSEHLKPTPELVNAIHRAKTGALIRVSVVAGGVYAGAAQEDVARLTVFGSKAGLAFQIVDDVLDLTVDSAQLGKTQERMKPRKKPPGQPSTASTRASATPRA